MENLCLYLLRSVLLSSKTQVFSSLKTFAFFIEQVFCRSNSKNYAEEDCKGDFHLKYF